MRCRDLSCAGPQFHNPPAQSTNAAPTSDTNQPPTADTVPSTNTSPATEPAPQAGPASATNSAPVVMPDVRPIPLAVKAGHPELATISPVADNANNAHALDLQTCFQLTAIRDDSLRSARKTSRSPARR